MTNDIYEDDGADAGGRLLRMAELHTQQSPETSLSNVLSQLIGLSRQLEGRTHLGRLGGVPRLIRVLQKLFLTTSTDNHVSKTVCEIGYVQGMGTLHIGQAGLPSSSSSSSEEVLQSVMLLLRVLRNLCAGVPANQDAFLACDAHRTIADVMVSLLRHEAGGASAKKVVAACTEHLSSGGSRQEIASSHCRHLKFSAAVNDVLRAGLQALGNFVGGGEAHKEAVWQGLVTQGTLAAIAATVQDANVQEPLCMILYSCCRTSVERRRQLCEADEGCRLMRLLLQAFLLDLDGYSATGNDGVESGNAGGVGETTDVPAAEVTQPGDIHHGGGEWLELVVKLLCLDGMYLSTLFRRLADAPFGTTIECSLQNLCFVPEHVAVLAIMCGVIIEAEEWKPDSANAVRSKEASMMSEQSVAFLLELVREAGFRLGDLERRIRSGEDVRQNEHADQTGLAGACRRQLFRGPPSLLLTGVVEVDLLGLSLRIIRGMCAIDVHEDEGREQASVRSTKLGDGVDHCDVVDALSRKGLVPLMIEMLQAMPPPSGVRAAKREKDAVDAMDLHEGGYGGMTTPLPPVEDTQVTGRQFSRGDAFRGYRRDLVAIIGNACFHRRHNQDIVRTKGALLTMLQQCVTDESNPFLREWGFWAMRNLTEGNADNRKELEALEMKGPMQTPELADLGLKVEVDERTGRPKLVNIGADEEKGKVS